MFKVIIKGKDIGKLFNFYSRNNPYNSNIFNYYLLSLTEEMDEFIPFIEEYFYSSFGDVIEHFYIKSHDSKKFNGINHFLDNEYLVFSFPDEETAFYFKLKFC